ncbi:MAG: hypothetical protein H0V51_05285 [Chloroflexi bacterium]|nr:hypothetical protein [Chloroflexota bacterium]
MSEDVVRVWAKHGWLRSHQDARGDLEVLRADVEREKEFIEVMEFMGGDMLTPEELDEMAEWQGRLPWKLQKADASP